METPQAIIAADFPKKVIPLIAAAKQSLRIIVYDWRWYPSVNGSSCAGFNAAIVSAAKRGVAVRALVNNDGVIAILKAKGIKGQRVHSERTLHTKLMIIDDTKIIIGSHNYSENAFSLNHEASILVELPAAENDFVSYFENLWGV